MLAFSTFQIYHLCISLSVYILGEIPSYRLFLYVAFDLHARVNYKLYFLIFSTNMTL